jgi:prophage regulatory protein
MEVWLRSINSEKVPDMNDANQPRLSILRRKQVQARTGLSRSTIYLYIKEGLFPKPIALGPRAVGWIESDVSDWIAQRMKAARAIPHVRG